MLTSSTRCRAQGLLKCENLGLSEEQLKATFPVIGDNLSDSGTFNNVLQLLVASGREIPEAMMMMIPEAWQSDVRFYAHVTGSWSATLCIVYCIGIEN